MEDLNDSIPSAGFEPLFIQEENGDPERVLMEQPMENNTVHPRLTFAQTQLNQSALIKPYLQEMDEILKSCEDLTGIPFGTHFSENYNETSTSELCITKGMECDRETRISPHAYLSTSYMDTRMDEAGTEDQPGQAQSQGMSSIINRRGASTDVPRKADLPLTSAGKRLSDSMVEYEGQLLGMLAMLENCMEEADMDFQPQDLATDASQEYVHISKSPHSHGETTREPTHQIQKLESQPAPVQCQVGQHGVQEEALKESRRQGEENSLPEERERDALFSPLFSMSSFSVESQDKSRAENQGVLDQQYRLSVPSMLLDSLENNPLCCEGMKRGYSSTDEGKEEGISGTDGNNTEFPAEKRLLLKRDSTDLSSGKNELEAVGSRMEECIEEVQRLQKTRKELLLEVLELRGHKCQEETEEETEVHISSRVAELMVALRMEEEGRREERKREIQSLRDERAEEERRMWKVNLERLGLQDELRKLKRRLFAMARENAHNQAALNKQQHEVELLKRDEEKLQSLAVQIMEEGSQLRSAHQQKLLSLQEALRMQSTNQASNAQEEMSQCKRHSCGDIQQYLQGGLRALEDWYEPILLTLLKRREATAGALEKAKEQAQELRARLRPLEEERQKLELQKACLEEKLKLTHLQRREDVGQYKETIRCLEESSRDLKTELTIQKRKTKALEELRDSLTQRVLLYRASTDDQCDHKEKT